MDHFDFAIVGAGIMGATTACELARQGASVALIDQASLPNPSAASVDHSKVFRFAYSDPYYARLAVESLGLWRDLEQETRTKLLTKTGVLVFGRDESGSETETFQALHALGLQVEMLTADDIELRFPQFNAGAIQQAVYDPEGGILHAEAAVRAVIGLARSRGVTVFENRAVNTIDVNNGDVAIRNHAGEAINCAKAMIAAGPWTRALLPSCARFLRTTRQEVVYFEPLTRAKNFDIGSFPIFLELSSGFYGFPIHHGRAVKLANHHKGRPVDPTSFDEHVGEDFIASCRAFYSRFVPELADARPSEARICLYNNTPDDDFIIDWLPETQNVLLVTGFSGHGFKFGSLVGRIASQMLLSGTSTYDIERFRRSRFS